MGKEWKNGVVSVVSGLIANQDQFINTDCYVVV